MRIISDHQETLRTLHQDQVQIAVQGSCNLFVGHARRPQQERSVCWSQLGSLHKFIALRRSKGLLLQLTLKVVYLCLQASPLVLHSIHKLRLLYL